MSLKQEDREDRIRRRALQLWQNAGLSEGDSLAYWQEAEDQEVGEESKTRGRTSESFPTTDPDGPVTGSLPSD